MTAQVILHERTGMIDTHATTRDARGARIKGRASGTPPLPGCRRPLDSHACSGILRRP